MTPSKRPDHTSVDRILDYNRYLVIGSVDEAGRPWATPVFFAPRDADTLVWLSSPDSRHSSNIERRPEVALTVFDSRVEVGYAEAAYFEARAERAERDDIHAALAALNARLPVDRRMGIEEVAPTGPLAVYQAHVEHRYVLVRGGDEHFRNGLDMTLEV
jgi:nitroimidazol reductase NimA-like FMN-containing flavoprotein (pyridoxamine 5'-phosphate oxidase superfamily)